ncbi:MAG: AraC family transcriptional regulator [Marmoricola sp.]|nr:AraC family transcriptional regulator [Marmoricola sp.]
MRAVLDGLRLTGAVFLRAEYTENWAFESLPVADLASALVPGVSRVTLFHVVASGRCWVETSPDVRHWATAGDVIVLPYGDNHRMGGTHDAELVSAGTLVAPPPWSEMPVVVYGEGGERTDIVCGYLTSDDPLFDPTLRALPPVFVVSPSTPAARAFVRASIDYALQQTSLVAEDRVAGATDVPRLLLAEVLRIHLSTAPSADAGWLRALRDPVLAPALAAVHADPGRKWTVPDLARVSLVSASSLDQRFRDVLGMPPIRYLTGWRMHSARSLLASSELSVATIARRVGYESEEAFSRAFKRTHGVAPGRWRTRGAATGGRQS